MSYRIFANPFSASNNNNNNNNNNNDNNNNNNTNNNNIGSGDKRISAQPSLVGPKPNN